MAIISTLTDKPKQQVDLIRSSPTIRIGENTFRLEDLNPSLAKFESFWDYMDTIYAHGYLRGAMSVIGRSAIGAWWTLRKHDEYGSQARQIQRKRLYSFYMMTENRDWRNIHDFQSFAFKLLIGVMYLRYFGRAAFLVLRNSEGTPIGLDFLPGLVIPNTDSEGYFRSPAFVQYTTRDPRDLIEYASPRDIIFVSNPDWEGDPLGGSDIESLAQYTIPLDIYLQSAASNYMQNRDVPEGIYQLSPDTDDDSYEAFKSIVAEMYRGHLNAGKSLVTVRGEVDFKPTRSMPSDLPYQDARTSTREEILGVSGTGGAKMGLTADISNANIREYRREFHETTMIPLFRLVELAFYEQIHVREFNTLGWEFKFNQPDFLTAVERATVDMREYQIGKVNPNELRQRDGLPPRTDDQGDLYYDQLMAQQALLPTGGQPGSPPEGRPVEPDDPSQVGEPNTGPQPPVRGDGHDDNTREDAALLGELRKWRAFALRRVKRGKPLRVYESRVIPTELGEVIQAYLEKASDADGVAAVFDDVFSAFDGGEQDDGED